MTIVIVLFSASFFLQCLYFTIFSLEGANSTEYVHNKDQDGNNIYGPREWKDQYLVIWADYLFDFTPYTEDVLFLII